jgi:hypothetical protein
VNEAINKETTVSPTEKINRTDVQVNQSPTQTPPGQEITFGVRRAKINRWIPRRWEENYTQIVILASLGLKSNTQLGIQFNFTPQHISNILNSPQASVIRKQIHETVVGTVSKDVPASLNAMAATALERLKTIIENPALVETKTEFIASLSLKLLAASGQVKDDSVSPINVGKAIIFTATDAEAMREAIRKSNEADRLNEGRSIEPPLRLLREAK